MQNPPFGAGGGGGTGSAPGANIFGGGGLRPSFGTPFPPAGTSGSSAVNNPFKKVNVEPTGLFGMNINVDNSGMFGGVGGAPRPSTRAPFQQSNRPVFGAPVFGAGPAVTAPAVGQFRFFSRDAQSGKPSQQAEDASNVEQAPSIAAEVSSGSAPGPAAASPADPSSVDEDSQPGPPSSEDVPRVDVSSLRTLVVFEIPEHLNTRAELLKHFGQFGKELRVLPNLKKATANITFTNHVSAFHRP